MGNLKKDEIIKLIERIIDIDGTEEEINEMILELKRNVPHPKVTNLIYYPPEGKELTPEEIAEEALNYIPLITPPPKQEDD